MFSLGVYCCSRYKAYNTFSEYMDGCIKKFLPVGKPSAIVTGDYKSTNAGNGLVARYAFEHNIPLRRFATLWGKHNPTKEGKKNNAGVASNAQIIKNSNGCVLFWTPTSVAKWDFMSGGCRSFLRMCDEGHLARPLIKIKVDIYAPDKEKVMEEPPSEMEVGGGIPSDATGGEYQSQGGMDSSPIHSLGGGSFGGGGGGISVSAPVASPSSISGASEIPVDGVGGQQMDGMTASDGGQSSDSIGNIDMDSSEMGGTADSLISKVPVDSNGDGIADTAVNAIDTDGNGTPDAMITPVDSDGNGTIDKLELSPMPTVNQLVAQSAPTPQPSQTEPQPTTAQNSSGQQQPLEDEQQKEKNQP